MKETIDVEHYSRDGKKNHLAKTDEEVGGRGGATSAD